MSTNLILEYYLIKDRLSVDTQYLKVDGRQDIRVLLILIKCKTNWHTVLIMC